jgi:pimeloyl-ACP methyl ester carboxylesterase
MTRPLHTLVPLCVCAVVAASCDSAQPGRRPEDVEFYSHGAKLSGSIVLPTRAPIRAAVVFVHGSGRQERDLGLARRFAAEGIAALVYDKRGVGRSEGVFKPGFTAGKDLEVLAADAAAASDALSRHALLKGIPTGVVGFSQAGWIVPLAAANSRSARFMALWSGPVCKTSEEDIYSQYTSDRDFRQPPTFEQVQALRQEAYAWDARFGHDIDPLDSLRRVAIPGLWVFGRDDGSIPVDLSIARLEQLQREGRSHVEYVVFSGVGHATIDPSFTTVASWITRTVGAASPTRTTAPTSGDLERYLGVYTSDSPRAEVTFTRQESGLVAASNGQRLALEHLGGHSFSAHDVGKGYIFLDFSPASRTLMVTQQGRMFTLRKVSR